MPKYRATLQVTGIAGENPSEVRSALDEQLRKSGLDNCRIVTVEPEGLRPPRSTPARSAGQPDGREAAWRRQANAGGLLLVAAAAWALWFFWWMFSNGAE